MIDRHKAASILSKKIGDLRILRGCDYDQDHYIFAVGKSSNNVNFQPQWFYVDKNSGKCGYFNPGADLLGFIRTMNTKSFSV